MNNVSRRISKIWKHGFVKTQREKATGWQCWRQKLPNFKQIHPEMPTNRLMLDTLEVLCPEATCHVLSCNLANALSIANHGHGNMHQEFIQCNIPHPHHLFQQQVILQICGKGKGQCLIQCMAVPLTCGMMDEYLANLEGWAWLLNGLRQHQ